MLGIGSLELFLIAVISLLFIGPERLPEVLRAVVGTLHRLQNYWQQLYLEFKQESGLDELDQDLHNKKIMGPDRSESKKDGTKDESE